MADKAPYHLLVVDDDEMNRDMLSRRLMRQGYTVILASNGAQALDLLRKEAVDLVLLDVMMPGIDGLEVLTTIRENHSIVELPVILVTARDQSGDVAAALGMGANDYVTKPINFPVLFARIQTQLSIKSAGATRVSQPASAPAASPAPSSSGSRSSSDDSQLRVPAAAQRATPVDFPTVSANAQVGDYEILSELGRGGMGAVYKARHLRMNRIVALKLINKERLSNPVAVQRFYQEIEAAAKLLHPNVVLAYDAGQVGETHYFAMEYVEGIDLDRLVQKEGPLPVARACDFIRQAALGLQHAHERGLVHRDIKPSNLLVASPDKRPEKAGSASAAPRGKAPAREAVVKILDLGLALLHQPTENPAAELTREGRVVGSVDYMAPEQWMNAHKVDIRADLYSLGCTFYYLLTGRVPFPGDETMEKMLKHHLDQPTPLEQHRPGVPAKVLAVVRRLMSKRREERYQTPAELAELLEWICRELNA